MAITSGELFIYSVRMLYGVVVGFAILLTAITFHGFHPIEDPMAPVTLLDRISYVMGVHEKSSVVILDLDEHCSSSYTYVFHRHISDGTFHVAEEKRVHILPGLFTDDAIKNVTLLDERIAELLDKTIAQLPSSVLRLRLRPNDCQLPECRPPILVAVAGQALSRHKKASPVILKRLHRQLENSSSFYVHPEKSFASMSDFGDKTSLRWFAISLMDRAFKNWKPTSSALILDVGEEDMLVTMAVTKGQVLPMDRVKAERHISAFGHKIKLVTFKYPGLGLYSAREHIFNMSSTPNVTSLFHEATPEIDVRSACINPVSDAFWQWRGRAYHVRGLANGTYELVKERNGPFAGKKINRPVAKYGYCHNVCSGYVNQKLRPTFDEKDGAKADKALLENIKLGGHSIYMEGLMREKAVERGLVLPDHGGDVKMRMFLESLKHACKVPNTEQPFACIDLMFLATLADQLLGFKQGSIIHARGERAGMTNDWPLGAAFHIYQNGL